MAKFKETSLGGAMYYWCYHGLGFDALYDLIFVKPFLGICRLLKSDPVDKLWGVLPALAHAGNKLSTKTQTGRISTHAITVGLGLAVVLIVAMAMVV